MIKTLIAGAAIGYLGKKLYDEGKLDNVIDSAKSKVKDAFPQGSANSDDLAMSPTVGQPLS